MAQNALGQLFRQQPWDFQTPNVGNFLAPILQGIEGGRRDQQQALENARAEEAQRLQRDQFGLQQGRYGMDQQRFTRDMALRDQTDPLTVQGARLGLDQTRAQIGATQASTAATYGNQRRQDESHRATMAQLDNMTPQQRAQIAPSLGITEPAQVQQFAYRYQPKPNTFDLKPDETRFELRPGPTPGVSTAVPIATGGTRDKSEDAFGTELAKGDAKQIQEMISGYPAIQQNIGKIGVMRQLSEHIGNPGMMNTIANSRVGQAARAVGLAPEQMATVESFTAMVNQMVPQQRPPGSGTMSDRDVDLFKASLPQVAATKEGRDFILAQAEAVARYDEARAKIAQEVAGRRMTRQQGMDRMMSLPNPLAGLEANLKQFGIAGAGRPVQAPGAPGAAPQQGGGQRAVNPQTGQVIELINGQWVPVGGGSPAPRQQADANGIPYPPASR